MGVDPASIAELWQHEEEDFAVWQVNWKSVVSFLKIETQWRVVGTPVGLVWLGLDYAAAEAALRKRSRRAFQTLLSDLRIMEGEALTILNSRGDA